MNWKICYVPVVAAIACIAATSHISAQSGCVVPSSWTSHAAVPAPSNAKPTTNCDFHVWAWNSFLWMTQDVGSGKLRFETFATLEELFDKSATLTSYGALPTKKKVVMTVRVNKSFEVTGLDSIFQAGSHGALVHGLDKTAGRAVYYSQNVNQSFFEFVRTNKYYDADTYAAADPKEVFPAGAAEFKYSWKIVPEGDDAVGFYSTMAQIYLLKETTDSSGKKTVVVDASRQEDVKVALVGIHVVGVVDGHPEFIWATFEHVDNAPDLPAGMSQQSDKPVSDKNWTFYHAGTPAKEANQNNSNDLKLVDTVAQTLSPTVDVFRAFAYGGGDAKNTDNITSLNSGLHGGILKGSVWENYMLVGGVWGQANSLTPGQLVSGIGSTSLANSTMETFDQTFAGVNCFACHGPLSKKLDGVTLPALNMNLSHIMVNGFFAQKVGN